MFAVKIYTVYTLKVE